MTTTLVEVVYPSNPAYTGPSQLDIGPFHVPDVNTLLRLEVHGKVNFQGIIFNGGSVEANFQLWAVQWVTGGAAPADCITTADGPAFLIRQQMGLNDTRFAWDQTSTDGVAIIGYGLDAYWAGQLAINTSIDLWLSINAPTGVSVPNQNIFASMRFWWI